MAKKNSRAENKYKYSINKRDCLTTPEFDVRKPAKNEYSKGLEAFLERAYILNKP